MIENLKQVEPTEEQVKPTSETKQVKPTQPEAKDAPLGKYTEEEFQKAQSGWGRQVTLSKAETEKVKAELDEAKLIREQAEAELSTLQREHEDLLADDPEKRRAYIDRQAISRAKVEHVQKETELKRREFEAEQKIQSASLAVKAVEVSRESGIPISDLEDCKTEEAMENKSLKFQIAKLGEAKEPDETTLKIDTAISTAVGSASFEHIRDEMIKNPSNDAIMRRYMEAKKAREG